MKSISKKLKYGVLGIAIALLVFIGDVKSANAVEFGNDQPILIVTGYSVTREKIVPGEDFVLSVDVKNFSKNTSATNIVFDFYNPGGVAPVYGTSPSVFVDNIAAGETKTIEVEYNTFTTISSDTLDFGINGAYNLKSFYTTLRIPVGSDSPFSIVSAYLPEQLSLWQTANASLTFKVLGDTNVSNVAFILRENGMDLVNSSLGVMTAGASKTHNIAFALGSTGIHSIQMLLQYMDEAGQIQEVEVLNAQLNVVDYTESPSTGASESEVVQEDDSYFVLIGAGGAVFLILCLMIVIVTKRRK